MEPGSSAWQVDSLPSESLGKPPVNGYFLLILFSKEQFIMLLYKSVWTISFSSRKIRIFEYSHMNEYFSVTSLLLFYHLANFSTTYRDSK